MVSEVSEIVNHFEDQDIISSRKRGNPHPLGLVSFGVTTFVFSFYNLGICGITHENVGLGLALFYGGFTQFIAGMLEMYLGNTLPATVFSSYGAFWLSFGLISLPSAGISAAYADPKEFDNAIGIFLTAWAILTIILLIGALRTNNCMIGALLLLFLIYVSLSLGKFTGQLVFIKIGGGIGVVLAILSFYMTLANMLTKENSYFTLPLGQRSFDNVNVHNAHQTISVENKTFVLINEAYSAQKVATDTIFNVVVLAVTTTQQKI
ncbi:6994_t:CDS:2 [Ambispora leptoticha]|uniref:6994_t:CDS:1 n=1 Tax=Ambispora leptoticha TaxID=144679 RepID=A0A9N9E4G0_9GLOM|nr:6994_t:CDS:2 [Ambispora leptoticha]